MPICHGCGKKFPNIVKIDGKRRFLHRRIYCLDCNPYGKRIFWGGKRVIKRNRNVKRHFICSNCGKHRFQKTRNNECSSCRSRVIRHKKKAELVRLMGGGCKICGYSRSMHAMDFHHLDASKKEGNISSLFASPMKEILRELKKCILVCCRCHSEIHEGLIKV